MILHFIFVVKEEEREKRKSEYEYVQQMSQFFKVWIKEKFGKDFEIQCDELITKPRGLFQKLDSPTLLRDHQKFIISISVSSDHFGLIVHVKDIMPKILE
jgi:hypothetical protein